VDNSVKVMQINEHTTSRVPKLFRSLLTPFAISNISTSPV
jgi:hypothetical protein